MTERTLSILKPDATRRNLTGKINALFEAGGLRIIAQKRVQLSRAQAEAFYGVHRERPFFKSLCDFMTSGPVVVQVLEGENAVARYRDLMGATDPAKAADLRAANARLIDHFRAEGRPLVKAPLPRPTVDHATAARATIVFSHAGMPRPTR